MLTTWQTLQAIPERDDPKASSLSLFESDYSMPAAKAAVMYQLMYRGGTFVKRMAQSQGLGQVCTGALNEVEFLGFQNGLGSIIHTQFSINVVQMAADSAIADKELSSDLPIRGSSSNQRQQLQFSGG